MPGVQTAPEPGPAAEDVVEDGGDGGAPFEQPRAAKRSEPAKAAHVFDVLMRQG
jgi:hypothetical protein